MKYICIPLLIILFSCSLKVNSDDFIITFNEEDIPEPIKLKGTKYKYEQLLNPRHIFFEGEFLIVGEKGNDTLLHAIKSSSNKYYKRIGVNGVGPGEITMVHRFLHDDESGAFWAYDVETKRLARYNVFDDSPLSNEIISQRDDFFLAVELAWSSDTTVMTVRTDLDEKFVEFNILNNEVTNTYGTWKEMYDKNDVPVSIISSIHNGVLTSNPTKDKFIKVGVQRDYIEILDKKSGKIISIRGPEQFMPDFKIDYSAGYPMPQTSNDNPFFYTSVSAESNNFYVLYSGKTMRQIMQGNSYESVLVFDYEGNLISAYDLDFTLLSFTVDEENRIFYGITYDSEPNVVAYRF
ncbi:BF3164 family lipoprotein [Arthrospiribacter ruber]|uniref:TolB-like 6-blade propeller-like n=1 Tax=Arthrospiribacter ruber TaxID=2487934 RepID=A0A951IWM2_9BACT|nr:BF3164 family lipoprotein [Arthrospiribacter ruber]MBW3466968.1 hypothetical protein [Arthrospiribacter ruber]